jgi:hypothetical protein
MAVFDHRDRTERYGAPELDLSLVKGRQALRTPPRAHFAKLNQRLSV